MINKNRNKKEKIKEMNRSVEIERDLGHKKLNKSIDIAPQDDNKPSYFHPGGRNTEFPSELSRVSHENNRGKVGSSESECSEPGSYRPSSQNETINVSGILSAGKTDKKHKCKKYQ